MRLNIFLKKKSWLSYGKSIIILRFSLGFLNSFECFYLFNILNSLLGINAGAEDVPERLLQPFHPCLVVNFVKYPGFLLELALLVISRVLLFLEAYLLVIDYKPSQGLAGLPYLYGFSPYLVVYLHYPLKLLKRGYVYPGQHLEAHPSSCCFLNELKDVLLLLFHLKEAHVACEVKHLVLCL